MRKMSSLVLALALVFALAGCKSGSVMDGVADGASSTSREPVSSASSDTSAAGGGIHAEDGYAEGRMGDTMCTSFFEYTVNSAYVADSFESYVPAEGSEMLVVEVTVKNTFRASIEMYDTDFQAQWNSDADEDFRVPITYNLETGEESDPLNDDQLPGTYTLAVNEEVTGLLVYEVPEGKSDFSISYLEFFDDDTTGDTFFVFFSAGKSAA